MGLLDKVKKFVSEKKTEKHFKKAGGGYSLGSSTSAYQQHETKPTEDNTSKKGYQSTRESRPADQEKLAAAALQRIQGPNKPTMNRSQKAIHEQAKREIEREKMAAMRDPDSLLNVKQHEIDEREIEAAPMLTQVLYTCELLDDDVGMTKDQLHSVLAQFLQTQLDSAEDSISAACLMIQTLNSGKEKKHLCTETLSKYVSNIINNPQEEKFRKIRCGNKALQERVLSLRGGEELILALGFERKKMEVGDGGSPEDHYYMSEENAELRLPILVQALDSLANTQPVVLRLYRNPTILSPNDAEATENRKLPDEFFELTADEIRREQEAQKLEVDRMLTLRTREMRERDETLRKFRYKYTLLRIAMPDGLVLQGTFNTAEKLAAVREFIRQHLMYDLPFELHETHNILLESDDSRSLGELQLMPAALMRLTYDADILKQIQHGDNVCFIKPESIEKYSEQPE